MELIVYRQSSKIRTDGTIVYKGEDALPFIDEQIFLVADGLGGASAIRHQNINPNLFDEDKIMETLFKNIYEDYENELFKKYVIDSFSELFAVKECYHDNINNIKKSGYFASRLVAAIIIHEMLFNSQLSIENIFSKLSNFDDDVARLKYLQELGCSFADIIKRNLQQIAKNASITYESSYSGLALLGTTLCATIYLEHENYVETLYLTAGDSRPYLWNVTDGLCQLLKDQEGLDGGMTNYIKANENADFDIRCNYFVIQKPCILFNASDGCFDSEFFLSQMAFEKTILDNITASETTQQLSKKLTDFFIEYGKHDDSSTIAMKIFGYTDYGELKKSAKKRYEIIEEVYLSVLPELLEYDYKVEYDKYYSYIQPKIVTLKEKYEEGELSSLYCERLVISEKYEPYIKRLEKIYDQIASEKSKITNAENQIKRTISNNYYKFISSQNVDCSKKDFKKIVKVNDIEARFIIAARDYRMQIENHMNEFTKTSEKISETIDRISKSGLPKYFTEFNDINIQTIRDCEVSMDNLFSFLYSLESKTLKSAKKVNLLWKEFAEANNKKADNYPYEVERLSLMIEKKDIEISSLDLISEERDSIQQALDLINDAKEEIHLLESTEKQKALDTSVKEYWDLNYINVIEKIVNDTSVKISNELLKESQMILVEFKTRIVDIKSRSEIQTELFQKYNKEFSKYIGE